MFVSIIVPAYRQEKTIKEDIENIHNVMSQTRWEFEIIVVVDGFLDETFEQASKIDRENVIVTGYKTNKGKGYAIRFGMARAGGDAIAFIDAGMEIDPNGISMILEHMLWYKADAIVGSKRHPASKVDYPAVRRLYSFGYQLLVFLLFQLNVRDTQVGLKIFRREVLEDVLPRLVVKRFAFDIELLAVAKRLGYNRIYEAPVVISWDFNNTSFERFLFLEPQILKMLRDTLGVFYRTRILRYYDDRNIRKWQYDKELNMRINTGEMGGMTTQDRIKELEAVVIDSESSIEKSIKKNELKKLPKFSVIIPVRSVNEFLLENIEHLKKLEYPKFEVLIILDVGEGFRFKDSRFDAIVVGDKGPGEKRNIGADNASGDILVFLDDDAYPSSDWLTRAAEIFEDGSVYALGAPAVTPPDVSLAEKVAGRVLESRLASNTEIYRHLPRRRRFIVDYPTVNLFVRKSAFVAVGGFTEEFWPGEDTKLCLDLVKEFGRPFLYHPEPIVYHHRRNLFWPFLKQISRYGQHRGQFSKIFPETSRIPAYFVPTLFVLGLFLGPVLLILVPPLWIIYYTVLSIYTALLVYEGIRVGLTEKSLLAGFYTLAGIFLTHLVYGINFLIGLIRKPQLELRNIDLETGNYIGG